MTANLSLIVDNSFDPRPTIDPDQLARANENAYPFMHRQAPRRDGFGLAAGGAIALLLGGVTFWSMAGHRHPSSVRAPAASGGKAWQGLPADDTRPTMAAVSPAADMTIPIARDMAPLPTTPDAAPADLAAVDPGTAKAVAIRRGFAPMLVVDTAAEGDDAARGKADPATPPLPIAAPPIGVAGADSASASATRLANPSTTVIQGTLMSAVLETAIDSDLPGYARAVITRDVLSFDRSRVLIPRSSRLVGAYKSGLADGQTRVYVDWTRLVRPDGVSIALASPATAPSGGTGLPGEVNGHFLKRFGSAILLSVVGAASAIGGPGVIVSAGSQSAASVAASHDVQVAPTVRVRPGQPLRVFSARDLDFSTVTATGTP